MDAEEEWPTNGAEEARDGTTAGAWGISGSTATIFRHENGCCPLAEDVGTRRVRLKLSHASTRQTQRSLSVADEELRGRLEISRKRRTLRTAGGGPNT